MSHSKWDIYSMDFLPPHDMITVIENDIGEKQMIDRVSPTQALASLGNGSIHHYMLISILRNPKKFGLTQVYRSGASLMCLFPVDDMRRNAFIALEDVSDLPPLLSLNPCPGARFSVLHAPESRRAVLAAASQLGPVTLEPGYSQYWLPALQPVEPGAYEGVRPLTAGDLPVVADFLSKQGRRSFFYADLASGLRFFPAVGYFQHNRLMGCCLVHPLGVLTQPCLAPSCRHRGLGAALLRHAVMLLRQSSLPVFCCIDRKSVSGGILLRQLGFQQDAQISQLRFQDD